MQQMPGWGLGGFLHRYHLCAGSALIDDDVMTSPRTTLSSEEECLANSTLWCRAIFEFENSPQAPIFINGHDVNSMVAANFNKIAKRGLVGTGGSSNSKKQYCTIASAAVAAVNGSFTQAAHSRSNVPGKQMVRITCRIARDITALDSHSQPSLADNACGPTLHSVGNACGVQAAFHEGGLPVTY